MRSDAAALVAQALDVLAHELRNATSTLWTATGLMADAPPDEVVEIAEDMRAPAEVALLFVDLLVEAARAARREQSLQAVDVSDLLGRAAKRARRGGLHLELGGVEAGVVLSVPGVDERLVCAALLATGCSGATARFQDGRLQLTAGDAPGLHERFAEAGGLLATVLADAAGADYAIDSHSLGFRSAPS